MIDTSARFEISPSVTTHDNPDEADEMEEIEIERDSRGTGHRAPATPSAVRCTVHGARSTPPLVRPDGYPSLTPLNHRFRRTNTPTLGPRQGPTGAELVAEANQAPRCRHIKASGVPCGAPALRGGEFCYFHNHTHNGARLIYPSLSRLEDAHGIQVALMEVLTGILDGRLDHKTGALLLYGLQTAACNLKHMPEIDPDDVTTGAPEPEEEQVDCDPQGTAAATIDAEKAAAAEGVRSTYEHLNARHHIASRPMADTAREARYAELMANYYRYDPDAPPDPGPHNECVDAGAAGVANPSPAQPTRSTHDSHSNSGGAGLQACNSEDNLNRASAPEVHTPAAEAAEKRVRSCRAEALLYPSDHGDSRNARTSSLDRTG